MGSNPSWSINYIMENPIFKTGDIIRLIGHGKFTREQRWNIGDKAIVKMGNHTSKHSDSTWIDVEGCNTGYQNSYIVEGEQASYWEIISASFSDSSDYPKELNIIGLI